MKFRILFGAAVMVASSGALATGLVGATGIASAAPSSKPVAYTCTGGDLATGTFTSVPSGNYSRITIKGVCNVVPNAVINVGDINVAPGAVFDAQSAPSTIKVRHNVTAGRGSFLGLGCQPEDTIGMFVGVPCADPYGDGYTTITINGNVTAINANTVLLRGAVAAGAGKLTVKGNVTLVGGKTDNPWSIKGATIGRNLTITGVTAEFLGVQFNTIGGNATLIGITVHDVDSPPPGVTIVENTVARNLTCFGLFPGVSGGFIPGEVNHVGHNAIGQCASISEPLS